MIDPSKITINRPIATFMIAIAICVFGFISYQQLSVNLLPKISYPTLTIRTEHLGAAPQEIEKNITNPIEEIVRTVDGVVSVQSTSFAGQSDVVLRFSWDTEMNIALQRVRERVELVPLDEEISPPLILRFDPDLDPILSIGLHGSLPLSELHHIAKETIEPELQKLEGVAMVRIRGGASQVVRIDVDPNKAALLGLSITALSNQLRSENINLAGGALVEGNVTYLVRTLNAFHSLDELSKLVISTEEGKTIYLSQIATIDQVADKADISTRIGVKDQIHPSLILEVYREPSANMIEVSDRVKRRLFGSQNALKKRAKYLGEDAASRLVSKSKKIIEKDPSRSEGLLHPRSGILLDELEQNVHLALLNDQSTFIEKSVSEVVQAALWGSFFAILVLFFFLRKVWATFIIAIAIPLSVIATFGAFRFFNVSLNVMSLGGLALGIGMLVDNAVVVLESIFRCREEGDGVKQAAQRGTSEVAGAVIASTLTSLAVFIPIAFVSGIAGQIFKDLALSVVFSLTASLGFALLFVPMLSALSFDESRFSGPQKENKVFYTLVLLRNNQRFWTTKLSQNKAWLPLIPLVSIFIIFRTILFLPLELIFGKIGGFFFRKIAYFSGTLFRFLTQQGSSKTENNSSLMHRFYRRILLFSLRIRYVVVLGALILFALSIWRFNKIGTRLLPSLHQGNFEVGIEFPVGTRLEESTQRIASLEKKLLNIPGIDRFSSIAGVEKSNLNQTGGEQSVRILVTLEPSEDPKESERRISDLVRSMASRIPGATVKIRKPQTLSLESAISVQIFHNNMNELQKVSSELRDKVAKLPGIRDAKNSLRKGYPEIRIKMDRERLANLKLSAKDVGEVIRSQLQGVKSTEIQKGERTLEVLLRTQPSFLKDVDSLRRIVVQPGKGGKPDIHLDSIATISFGSGPSEIRHLEGRRVALISASVPFTSISLATQDIRTLLQNNPPKSKMSYHIGGQSGMSDEAFKNLFYAFLLAVFLVYIVLASKFESFIGPLVILLSIPLSISGVVVALEITGTHLSVLVFVGLIMLAGIVVNNAIVLVDYINQLRTRYDTLDEAISAACSTRLRPILITTATTILGLAPMALGLGEGAELRQPLAITVIAGLLSSTILTLVVIPSLYRIMLASDTSQTFSE